MKKGFTMIELIFVIVILGILASVAIPRLASTRADAETSAAIGNLRTLLSDAGAYQVVKGSFAESGVTAKWKAFTNVPLKTGNFGQQKADNIKADTPVTNTVWLSAGGTNCIGITITDKSGNAPAYMKFTTSGTTDTDPKTAEGVCAQVQGVEAVKAFINSTITYNDGGTEKTISNAMAIGSNTEVYNTIVNGNNNPPQNQ